jgi:hypothetical protein
MQKNTAEKQVVTQFELSKQLVMSKFFSKVHLSPSARLVLMVLCSHYPNIYPSIKTIQEEAGIASNKSVISALKELSGKGLILYETKNCNNYTLTSVFFAQIEGKNYTQINNLNKKDNKDFKNFSNFRTQPSETLPKYHHNTHITGITYKKYEPEKQTKKESPLDLSREQAIEFLKNLPQRMQNTYFATELRKKWNL